MKVINTLIPPFLVVYPDPVNLYDVDKAKFAVGVHTSFQQVNLYRKIFGLISSEGFAFSTSKQLLAATQRTRIESVKNGILFLWLKKRFRKFSYSDSVFLVFDEWSSNYFHFWNDLVPRLFLNKDFIIEHNLDILVDSRTMVRGKAIFEILGFKRIREIRQEELLFARQIFLCDFISLHVGSFHPPTLQNLRAFIFERLRLQSSAKNRVYISRRKANYRKLINEAAIISLLAEHNFEIVDAEDLTILEQIKMFKDVGVILGVHGAGMCNMLFCEPGASIVEIRFDGGIQNNLFLQLAGCLGHQYYYLFADAVGTDDFQSADLYVNVNKLGIFLHKYFPVIQ